MIGTAAEIVTSARPVAPAVFIGTQSCPGVMPDFDLWNLTADIAGHCIGSTVSSDTLLAAGFSLPVIIGKSPAEPIGEILSTDTGEPLSTERRRHAWHATRRSMNSRHPFAL